MALIKLNEVDEHFKVTEHCRTLANHQGRIFIGEKKTTRREISLREAITLLIEHRNDATTELKLYLTPKPKPKPQSRQGRWIDAASTAATALRELAEIQNEYADWHGNTEDSFAGTAMQEKLDEVVNLDIETACETAEEAESMDLPLGFGRD